MTEPQFEEPGATTEAPDAPRSGRGRPRAQATLARDEAIIGALSDGVPRTREQLADMLGEEPSLVYLGLWRLARSDPPRVEKTSDGNVRHAWRLIA